MPRKSSAMQAKVISLGVAGVFLLLVLIFLGLPNGPSSYDAAATPAKTVRASVPLDVFSPDTLAEDPLDSLEDPLDTLDDPLSSAVRDWSQKKTDIPFGDHPFDSDEELATDGKIDGFVFGKLEELGIEPAKLCSDAVFVRRVYLDVTGTLPTADEARGFLEDDSPDKRSVLIDDLLERPEFADYWAMKWSDLLRVKAEFPINLWPHASQAYHRWLRNSIIENMPYDVFARELLTASGSNFRVPQVNFYRAVQNREPESIVKVVALAFMGARTDTWPPERLAGMGVFFSQIGYKPTGEWKEQIVIFDPSKGELEPGQTSPEATFPDGTPARIDPDQDPREVFTDWLITPENPWFTRHIVNRIWYWLLGRGIVHEPDDIRSGNPPQNLELLNWLGEEMVASGYDTKSMFRLILNSNAYQLSCVPATDNAEAAVNFAHYPLRRMEAEVLIDALCQITGTTESYSSMIPEPFTFIPEDHRSITLPDGSITSPFLEMFGRPPRDTGIESERNNRSTAAQRLHLLNSSHIRRKIQDGPKLRAVLDSGKGAREIAETIYLTVLSRFPTQDELDLVVGYCGSRRGGETVAWALINTEEFLHRH